MTIKLTYEPIKFDGIRAQMLLPRELLELDIEFEQISEKEFVITKIGNQFVVRDYVITTVDGYAQEHPELGSVLDYVREQHES